MELNEKLVLLLYERLLFPLVFHVLAHFIMRFFFALNKILNPKIQLFFGNVLSMAEIKVLLFFVQFTGFKNYLTVLVSEH